MGGKKATPMPAIPIYQQPAPYTPAPPPTQPAVSAPTYVPPAMTAAQIGTAGADFEKTLNPYLQLGSGNPLFPSGNPLDPVDRARFEENYYQQYENPGIAQAQADLYANGQNAGSYAGGLVGSLLSNANLNKFNAGINYAQGIGNEVRANRASYLSGGPTVASQQNALDINRGMGVANLEYQKAANENAYNAGNTAGLNNYNLAANQGANQFALGAYGAASNNYNMGIQQQQNQALGLGSLGLGLLKQFGGPIGGAIGKGVSAIRGINTGGTGGGTSPGYFGSAGGNLGGLTNPYLVSGGIR